MSKVEKRYNQDGTVTKTTVTNEKVYKENYKPGLIFEKGKTISRSVSDRKK